MAARSTSSSTNSSSSSSSSLVSLSSSLLDATRGGRLRDIDRILTSMTSSSLSSHDQLTVISSRDDSGRTPLHWAAIAGDDKLVARLLSMNANPNLQDGQGQTSLHLALREKHTSTAEIIARHSHVDVLVRDSFGRLPIHWACQCQCVPVVTLCIAGMTTANNTATRTGTSVGSDTSTNVIDTPTQSGDTALHWAVIEGALSCVTLLLQCGASPMIRNQRGETPLDMVSLAPRYNSDITKLLQAHVPPPIFVRAASDGGVDDVKSSSTTSSPAIASVTATLSSVPPSTVTSAKKPKLVINLKRPAAAAPPPTT